MSVQPANRQLQRAEGRQWRGSTTFDIEYQGQTTRVEALLSRLLEDGIFLGWTTLRDLIRGPNRDSVYFDKQSPTLNTELRRDILEPEISRNHADTIRLEGLRRRQEHTAYKPNKPCAGCGEDEIHHYREDCPNRNKRCYSWGKTGHVREVCRRNPVATKDERHRAVVQ